MTQSDGPTIIPHEQVIATAPVVVRRTVKWGEIDFARVAFTGKFLDWMLEAAETWFTHLMGEHWAAFDVRHDVTLPVVGTQLDFHIALHPGEQLDLTVTLARIGRSSHTVAIKGENARGDHCFDGTLTFAAIDPETEKSVAMPDILKERLEAYNAACEG